MVATSTAHKACAEKRQDALPDANGPKALHSTQGAPIHLHAVYPRNELLSGTRRCWTSKLICRVSVDPICTGANPQQYTDSMLPQEPKNYPARNQVKLGLPSRPTSFERGSSKRGLKTLVLNSTGALARETAPIARTRSSWRDWSTYRNRSATGGGTS